MLEKQRWAAVCRKHCQTVEWCSDLKLLRTVLANRHSLFHQWNRFVIEIRLKSDSMFDKTLGFGNLYFPVLSSNRLPDACS
jgi:hypothetical protein